MDTEKALNSLLAMAEYFRTQHQVKEAIHCLLATFELKPSPRVEMRSRVQLALLLYYHTSNSKEAVNHLEKVMLLSRSSGQVAELHETRFEAASLMARIYAEQSFYQQAKSILRKVLDFAAQSPYWYLRLILQLADINACERDSDAVTITLSKAVEYSQTKGAVYTQLLCLLCKGSHLLTLKNYQEAGRVLNHCHTVLESYTGPQSTILHAFYLVIQVTHLLSAAQLKLAKPHLKQLQQKAKILNSEMPSRTNQGELTAEDFEWLSKEHIFVLVYLVSSMHASSCGNVERGILYAEKALQIMTDGVNIQVFNMLRAHVIETMISCKIIEGKYTESLNLLGELLKCCHSDSKLVYSHRASLHTLIGLYVLSLGKNLEQAVAQFHCALQHTNMEPLRLFISLNLAIAYIKIGPSKESELSALVSSIQPDQESLSQSLRAAAYYVKGLYCFTILKLHDAKHYLRETLAIASDADLNKLTASALVLLAQIYLALGTRKEAKDMASPALEIAQKTGDVGLQLWAGLLVKDLQQMSGDLSGEAVSRSIVESASRQITQESTDTDHHPLNSHLTQWTTGEWPVARLPLSHAQCNGGYKEEVQKESTSAITTENSIAVTNTPLVHDQSVNSCQQNKLPYSNTPSGADQSSSSVYNPHQVNIQHQMVHQSNPYYQSSPVHQFNPMYHQVNPVHPANRIHQVTPMHQMNLTHQVNPVYQVNPAHHQLTRQLHHYNPTQVSVPTQVNTSYSHTSDALLHRYQMDHMHAMHPQQAHYYNNSTYSFKH